MTFKPFVSRLNWRLILIHSIATWFIVHSFPLLAKLYDIELYENLWIIIGDDKEKIKGLFNNDLYLRSFQYFYLTEAAWIIGLFASLIISLVIARKKKWFWVNSLIVFFLMLIVMQWNISGWRFLKIIFLTPGGIFKNNFLMLLTNGLVLLGLGLFVFYNKRFRSFIDGGKIPALIHQIN